MLIQTERPPMGWNSWNVYLGSPKEEELKATMRTMAQNLLPYGYEYCVTDASWYYCSTAPDEPSEEYPTPHMCIDKYGRLCPHPMLYPSAADGSGFLHISRYAHALGLKFGLHLMRGMSTSQAKEGLPFRVKGTDTPLSDVIDYNNGCLWAPHTFGVKIGHPAAQAWYDSIFELLAEWEIDFVKYDDLGSPLRIEEIKMIHNAIDRCGRDMVLSLSPGGWTKRSDAEFYSQHATMWRITKDFWDSWNQNLRESFDVLARWNDRIEAPGWPDPDMIPIGWICESSCHFGRRPREVRFTLDEQRSMFTLFCISRSPLILTVNLLRNTDNYYRLQTQPDCLALDQRGENCRVLQSGQDEKIHIWRGRADGNDYLAVFNMTGTDDFYKINIPEDLRGKRGLDVWTGDFYEKPFGEELSVTLAAHGCVLLRLMD